MFIRHDIDFYGWGQDSKDGRVFPWVKWDKISLPKMWSGRGLNNLHMFSKALVAKFGWRLLSTDSLWTEVVSRKYIRLVSLEDWIRVLNKQRLNVSAIWKMILASF